MMSVEAKAIIPQENMGSSRSMPVILTSWYYCIYSAAGCS